MSESNELSGCQEPPTTPAGILRKLGPGLIIAGSIVGAGELIATTAVGAEAGFVLLWLIIIGCLIKVFVQIEFGRFWDMGLWLSCAGLFVAGGYAFYTNVVLHFIGGSGR